jgi:hypothetical protein
VNNKLEKDLEGTGHAAVEVLPDELKKTMEYYNQDEQCLN